MTSRQAIKMRSRPLDNNKRLPIKPTDDNAYDDGDHAHGKADQAADASAAAAATQTKAVAIPTPPIRIVPEYDKQTFTPWAPPRHYIKCHVHTGATPVHSNLFYDVLNDDIRWLDAINAKEGGPNAALSEDAFAKLIETWEVQCGRSALPDYVVDPNHKYPRPVAAQAAHAAGIAAAPHVLDAAYTYWRDKRMSWGKALMRPFQAPPSPENPSPHIAFRPRAQSRRASHRHPRKNDALAFQKMRLLHRQLQSTLMLLDCTKQREELKQHAVLLAAEKFDAALAQTPAAKRAAAALAAAKEKEGKADAAASTPEDEAEAALGAVIAATLPRSDYTHQSASAATARSAALRLSRTNAMSANSAAAAARRAREQSAAAAASSAARQQQQRSNQSGHARSGGSSSHGGGGGGVLHLSLPPQQAPGLPARVLQLLDGSDSEEVSEDESEIAAHDNFSNTTMYLEKLRSYLEAEQQGRERLLRPDAMLHALPRRWAVILEEDEAEAGGRAAPREHSGGMRARSSSKPESTGDDDDSEDNDAAASGSKADPDATTSTSTSASTIAVKTERSRIAAAAGLAGPDAALTVLARGTHPNALCGVNENPPLSARHSGVPQFVGFVPTPATGTAPAPGLPINSAVDPVTGRVQPVVTTAPGANLASMRSPDEAFVAATRAPDAVVLANPALRATMDVLSFKFPPFSIENVISVSKQQALEALPPAPSAAPAAPLAPTPVNADGAGASAGAGAAMADDSVPPPMEPAPAAEGGNAAAAASSSEGTAAAAAAATTEGGEAMTDAAAPTANATADGTTAAAASGETPAAAADGATPAAAAATPAAPAAPPAPPVDSEQARLARAAESLPAPPPWSTAVTYGDTGLTPSALFLPLTRVEPARSFTTGRTFPYRITDLPPEVRTHGQRAMAHITSIISAGTPGSMAVPHLTPSAQATLKAEVVARMQTIAAGRQGNVQLAPGVVPIVPSPLPPPPAPGMGFGHANDPAGMLPIGPVRMQAVDLPMELPVDMHRMDAATALSVAVKDENRLVKRRRIASALGVHSAVTERAPMLPASLAGATQSSSTSAPFTMAMLGVLQRVHAEQLPAYSAPSMAPVPGLINMSQGQGSEDNTHAFHTHNNYTRQYFFTQAVSANIRNSGSAGVFRARVGRGGRMLMDKVTYRHDIPTREQLKQQQQHRAAAAAQALAEAQAAEAAAAQAAAAQAAAATPAADGATPAATAADGAAATPAAAAAAGDAKPADAAAAPAAPAAADAGAPLQPTPVAAT